jgi:hypothetical protein
VSILALSRNRGYMCRYETRGFGSEARRLGRLATGRSRRQSVGTCERVPGVSHGSELLAEDGARLWVRIVGVLPPLAFYRWLEGEDTTLGEVSTDTLLRFLVACRVARLPGRRARTWSPSRVGQRMRMRPPRSTAGGRRSRACSRSARCGTRTRQICCGSRRRNNCGFGVLGDQTVSESA